LGQWIIGHFPDHQCYVEPFAGAASVLIQKPRSPLEVYNDLDGAVVNFFRVLRQDPDQLIRSLSLTPYSRAEYELSYEPTDDELEAARRFYVRAYMSIGGATGQWRTGWRYQAKAENVWKSAADGFADIDHLYAIAHRFRGVQIENDDAIAVMERFDRPETLFYLDPPYVFDTRSKWAGVAYQHELSDDDHVELATRARDIQGLVIISGYPSELYERELEDYGWVRVETSARTNSTANNNRRSTEAIWISPRTDQALNETVQLAMF
jgi:DNA adenine methylase